jgi:nucleotide-binding universal stress UspA family protein
MKVLLAIDDSHCSCEAIESVLERPWPEKTRFHIFSVVEPFHPEYAGWHASYVPLAIEAQHDRMAATRKLVEGYANRLKERFGDDSVSSAVAEGYIKDRIIEAAQTWPADLIVMGSHGRTGLEKLLMGSVSQSVMSSAPCSVEIVKKAS